MKDKLVDAVIEQMKSDIDIGDWAAIDELLHYVPNDILIGYLPEEDWGKFKKGKK